jgi:hypothetical protein
LVVKRLVGLQRFVDGGGQLGFIEVDPFIGSFQGRNGTKFAIYVGLFF